MSFAEIKEAAEKLSAPKRRQLAAHLLALTRRSPAAFRRDLARKIDDRNPAHWFSLEEARKRLL
jgi:hypothetical protein